MFFGLFSTHLHRKMDLTNAFKSFFRNESFKLCSKIAGFPGKQQQNVPARATPKGKRRSPLKL